MLTDRIIAESLENTDDPVFTCPECRQEYTVPENGFPVFRLLERFREQLDTAEPQQEEETYSQSGTGIQQVRQNDKLQDLSH